MKRFVMTLAATAVLSATAHAESLNIVTIDVGEVLKQYPAAISFESDMKNKAEEYKAKRTRMVQEMKKLETAYLEARKASRSSAFSEEKRQEKMKEAEEFIKKLIDGGGGRGKGGRDGGRPQYAGPEPEVGKIYTGKIMGTHNFGVFVEILPGAEDGSTPGLSSVVCNKMV